MGAGLKRLLVNLSKLSDFPILSVALGPSPFTGTKWVTNIQDCFIKKVLVIL